MNLNEFAYTRLTKRGSRHGPVRRRGFLLGGTAATLFAPVFTLLAWGALQGRAVLNNYLERLGRQKVRTRNRPAGRLIRAGPRVDVWGRIGAWRVLLLAVR